MQLPIIRAIQDQEGNLLLFRNGQPLRCPFAGRVPIPVRTSLGQTAVQMDIQPCGSYCPHFYKGLQDDRVFISCSGTMQELAVILEETPEKDPLLPPTGKLISL